MRRDYDTIWHWLGPTTMTVIVVLCVVFLVFWLRARARASYYAWKWGEAMDALDSLRKEIPSVTPFPEDDDEDDEDDDFDLKLLRNPDAWKDR